MSQFLSTVTMHYSPAIIHY